MSCDHITLIVTQDSLKAEQKFDTCTTVAALKKKLEALVGTAAQDQKLELQDPSTGTKKVLDDETQSLKQLAVANNQVLVVIDTSKEKKPLAGEEASLYVKVGDRCQVTGAADAPVRVGEVAFVGSVQFTAGLWVGVKFDEAVGKNDGSVGGVRYFECEVNHGSFVKPANVYPLQAEKKCCSRCL